MKVVQKDGNTVTVEIGGAVLCVRARAGKGCARFDVWTGRAADRKRVGSRVLEPVNGKLHDRIWNSHVVVVVPVK